jgi:hypothetical protein
MLKHLFIWRTRRSAESSSHLIEIGQRLLNMYLVELGTQLRAHEAGSEFGFYGCGMGLTQNEVLIGQRDQPCDFLVTCPHSKAFDGLQERIEALAKRYDSISIEGTSVVLQVSRDNTCAREYRTQKYELSYRCFARVLFGFALSRRSGVQRRPDQAKNRRDRTNCLDPRGPVGLAQIIASAKQNKVDNDPERNVQGHHLRQIQCIPDSCHFGSLA